MLPLRTERQYLLVKIVLILGPLLAKPLFNLIEGKLKGKKERPVYEGQDLSGAEDTVPTAMVALGEFFLASKQGRQFVENHFDQLKKAVDFFKTKTGDDGLAIIKNPNPDWADSLTRKGKLGLINVLWARSLRLMEFMAKSLGREEDAKQYKDEFKKVKESVMEKLYNKEEGYFRAKEGEDRLDTAASVFGALYFLNPSEAAKVEETIEKRVRHNSGLKNFDPPYPQKEIFWTFRALGTYRYHNEYVWPWLTCQNIQVKIKIALRHPDEKVRNQYKEEATKDLADMADLFNEAGGAYEIFWPDERKPAGTTLQKSQRNLMGSMAAYQGAYLQLKELGWLESEEEKVAEINE